MEKNRAKKEPWKKRVVLLSQESLIIHNQVEIVNILPNNHSVDPGVRFNIVIHAANESGSYLLLRLKHAKTNPLVLFSTSSATSNSPTVIGTLAAEAATSTAVSTTTSPVRSRSGRPSEARVGVGATAER